ncbi:CAP domain-containing protein [Ruegeria atlantica]|uniref:Cysteine-rich secretory protein family protein n=1 Tax=Ruegeria atlantica TaxID=81569 RepID=A0A0N7LNU8_9RHOB|nr:CAP domain-containing protein [Ruegeria atlantica]CUH43420.1 Cysteine-rich secretory protein family protein [Ruegeria atlantica]
MSQASTLEREMLNLINAERASRGLDPVQLESRLNASAEEHSQWMLESGSFAHKGEGGSSATQRMRDAGFVLSGSWSTAENIAWQIQRGETEFSGDVVDLHIALMNSPDHRENILNPNLTYIGIGIEIGSFGGVPAVIATQNFARTSASVQLETGAGSDAGGSDTLTDPVPIVPDSDEPASPVSTSSQESISFGGSDTLRGTPEELDQSVIGGFGVGKSLVIEGVVLNRSNSHFTSNSNVEFDLDGDGKTDLTIFLDGGQAGGDFFAIAKDGNTVVSYADYLPGFAIGGRVDSSLINGIVNKTFLEGNATADLGIQMVKFGTADFNNNLGVYDILSNGEIANVRLLFEDTNNANGAGELSNLADGNRLEFFIVEDGADWAQTLADGADPDFVAGNGTLADVDDEFDFILTVNGNSAGVTTFHAEKAALNSDDQQHALSGVASGGQSMNNGFEDLTGGRILTSKMSCST